MQPNKINIIMKYKINSDIDIKDFILNIKENFKADAKVLYAQRNIIKLFEIDGKQYVVKSFKTPNWFNRIIYSFFRKSKAARSYINSQKLQKLKINTPNPIAYIEFRPFFLLKESFYISEYFDFDYQIGDALHNTNFPSRDIIFEQFAKFTFDVYSKGVYHSDYNHGNILLKNVKGVYTFSLVDVNRVKFITMNDNLRMKNLCRLTTEKNNLKKIIFPYCKISKQDPEHLMNLLNHHKNKLKKHHKRKLALNKILRRV